jgi:DivIVA domain-containing protein
MRWSAAKFRVDPKYLQTHPHRGGAHPVSGGRVRSAAVLGPSTYGTEGLDCVKVAVMHTSEWLLDSPSASEVANAQFQIVRRGYDPVEVQAFARAVSSELVRLSAENDSLRDQIRVLEARVTTGLDEQSIAQFLGEETTRLLTAARDTSAGVVARAEQKAATTMEQAIDDARRVRTEANAEATSERRRAGEESRQMIAEATAHRRTMLQELARRRDVACRQLQELLRGREVLVQALAHVSGTAGDLIARLDAISAEPGDFVNLDPSIEGAGTVVDPNAVLTVSSGEVGIRGERGRPLGPKPNRSEAPGIGGNSEPVLVMEG